MKKKLIAIVASLAMVATLVPATAFADVTKGTTTLAQAKTTDYDGKTGVYATYKEDLLNEHNEANVTFIPVNGGLELSGVLPYAELEGFSGVKELNEGCFIGFKLTTDGGNPFIVREGKHMSGDKVTIINSLDYLPITSPDLSVIRLDEVDKNKGYTIKLGFNDGAMTGEKWYVEDKNAIPDSTENIGNFANISDITPKLTDANSTEVTLDISDLTLLTKEETTAINKWMTKVDAISSPVTDSSSDKLKVTLADEAYAALSTELKAAIQKVRNVSDAGNYKAAFIKMEDAKKAVELGTSLSSIDEKIARLKDLPEKEFKDQAEIESYFAPLNEVLHLVAGLSDTEKAQVTRADELERYHNKYKTLIKKYVDPLYAAAAKIDLSSETLADTDLALIRELKVYVEGEYIKTGTITNFNQATYDALVAALDKVAKDESSLENATIAAIADQAYTGAAIEPAVTVTDKAGKEVPTDDYTVIYSNNKDAGTATVTVAAKSSSAYTGSVSTTFTITPAALTDAMVKSVANATYTGKAVTPAVTVEKGVTYDVTYKNNTAVGKATATITGTGNYTGTITKTFIVKPAKEAISSLKAGKKSLTVAYKAQTGAKYRIVYSPAKGQAKAVNTTATKKTIKSLKAGKTYKVKVRAYKVVDGKTYNGTYSTVKKVKVK